MRVLKYNAPRDAMIVDAPTPKPGAGQILCKSLYCSISAGTEMGFYRGTAPQIHSVYDTHNNFADQLDAMTYPMQANTPGVWWMGYANVSQILSIGDDVEFLKVGDIVFSQSGHCDHQLLNQTDVVKLPDGINHEHAALIALLEIAFNGILDAKIRLTETAVIFGLGPVGQLILQLAKLSGAKVIAIDALPTRLDLAKQMGADAVLNYEEVDVVKEVFALTGDRGADVVFEASGNIKALTSATQACCYNGRLIAISFYQQAAETLYLGKEFHHKRIRLISSQVCGLSPDLGQAWSMRRRRQATVELVSKLQLAPLISARISFDEVPSMLSVIDKNPASCNAVIIKY